MVPEQLQHLTDVVLAGADGPKQLQPLGTAAQADDLLCQVIPVSHKAVQPAGHTQRVAAPGVGSALQQQGKGLLAGLLNLQRRDLLVLFRLGDVALQVAAQEGHRVEEGDLEQVVNLHQLGVQLLAQRPVLVQLLHGLDALPGQKQQEILVNGFCHRENPGLYHGKGVFFPELLGNAPGKAPVKGGQALIVPPALVKLRKLVDGVLCPEINPDEQTLFDLGVLRGQHLAQARCRGQRGDLGFAPHLQERLHRRQVRGAAPFFHGFPVVQQVRQLLPAAAEDGGLKGVGLGEGGLDGADELRGGGCDLRDQAGSVGGGLRVGLSAPAASAAARAQLQLDHFVFNEVNFFQKRQPFRRRVGETGLQIDGRDGCAKVLVDRCDGLHHLRLNGPGGGPQHPKLPERQEKLLIPAGDLRIPAAEIGKRFLPALNVPFGGFGVIPGEQVVVQVLPRRLGQMEKPLRHRPDADADAALVLQHPDHSVQVHGVPGDGESAILQGGPDLVPHRPVLVELPAQSVGNGAAPADAPGNLLHGAGQGAAQLLQLFHAGAEGLQRPVHGADILRGDSEGLAQPPSVALRVVLSRIAVALQLPGLDCAGVVVGHKNAVDGLFFHAQRTGVEGQEGSVGAAGIQDAAEAAQHTGGKAVDDLIPPLGVADGFLSHGLLQLSHGSGVHLNEHIAEQGGPGLFKAALAGSGAGDGAGSRTGTPGQHQRIGAVDGSGLELREGAHQPHREFFFPQIGLVLRNQLRNPGVVDISVGLDLSAQDLGETGGVGVRSPVRPGDIFFSAAGLALHFELGKAAQPALQLFGRVVLHTDVMVHQQRGDDHQRQNALVLQKLVCQNLGNSLPDGFGEIRT